MFLDNPIEFVLNEIEGRRFKMDFIALPPEVPSHKRSYLDRMAQSAEAKRQMLNRIKKVY